MKTSRSLIAGLLLAITFAANTQAAMQQQLPVLDQNTARTTPSHSLTAAQLLANAEPNSAIDRRQNVVTRTVDLAETIAKYSKVSELPIEKARAETISFLGITPLNPARRISRSGATFEMAGTDQYSITANELFFESLPSSRACLEAGKKQVLIDCLTLEVTASQLKFIRAIVEKETSPPDQVVEAAELASHPLAHPNFKSQQEFVASSTTVRELVPSNSYRISQASIAQLIECVRSGQGLVQQAPKIIAMPGQECRLEQVTEHPFVVNAKLKSPQTVAPEFKILKSGTVYTFQPSFSDKGIYLAGCMQKLKIQNVRTVSYQAEESVVTLQVPTHAIRTTEFGAHLKSGDGLLISPNFQTIASDPGVNRKPTKTTRLILVTAKELDMQGEPDQ